MSEWNATMYDNKHDFVAEYGKGLLEYIPQNEKQSIIHHYSHSSISIGHVGIKYC